MKKRARKRKRFSVIYTQMNQIYEGPKEVDADEAIRVVVDSNENKRWLHDALPKMAKGGFVICGQNRGACILVVA